MDVAGPTGVAPIPQTISGVTRQPAGEGKKKPGGGGGWGWIGRAHRRPEDALAYLVKIVLRNHQLPNVMLDRVRAGLFGRKRIASYNESPQRRMTAPRSRSLIVLPGTQTKSLRVMGVGCVLFVGERLTRQRIDENR